jgi:hypothetical protein
MPPDERTTNHEARTSHPREARRSATALAGNFPSAANPAGKPFVDVGKSGLDARGDSIGIAGTKGAKFTVTVTAKPGQTLYSFCAVHPWMQGIIHVK